MANKKTPIKKLIKVVEGFEEKRKKEGITLDLPTRNQFDGIIHWANYMSDAMEKGSKDLAELIYPMIMDFYNTLHSVSFFLTSGKFAEHKEAEWLQSECKQISDCLRDISDELYGADDDEED